ncbi:hypothetical protein [Actinomadura sp. 3N407]|uniref:hypothetical protein n=1 Tax=Actinomadura sp. 3N407 TaxID=3457423 RepID=UPI003FCC85AA
MSNTGLIAEVTRLLNQPLTIPSNRQLTSSNPHPSAPPSDSGGLDGAGLDGAEPDGDGEAGAGDAGADGELGADVLGVGDGVEGDGVDAAADVGSVACSARTPETMPVTARAAKPVAQQISTGLT